MEGLGDWFVGMNVVNVSTGIKIVIAELCLDAMTTV